MQLKTIVIFKILKIRMDKIWDARIDSRIFRQIVVNKQEWFLDDFAPIVESEDKRNYQ